MIISGAIDTGIPDITVVIRENSDANKLLVNVPNVTVNVQKGSNYNVNIQPNSLVVQRTGSLPSLAISAYSASYALTASYVEGDAGITDWSEITNKPIDLVSSSTQVKTFLPDGTVSSSLQYPGWVTASSQIDYTQLQNIPVNIVSSSQQVIEYLPTGTVSSSTQINTGSFTGSFNGIFTGVVSGAAATASYVEYNDIVNKPTLVSSSIQVDVRQTTGISTVATTGSNIFVGDQIISGSLTTTADTMTFNGSMVVSGTLAVTGSVNNISGGFTGSFKGDGSQLTGIPTALQITGSTSGTDVINLITDGLIFSSSNNITTTVTDNTLTIGVVDIVSQSSQIDVRNTIGITTIATTGSNIFNGIQHITNTTNSSNYTDGALIVDGGVGITKDVNISGSLNVYGLLTAVSQSVLYVTSSQLNVGTNIITVNTDNVLRFGGLEVFDSGSPGHSGSLLWDSYYNRWIYQNESGSSYNSAILIAGPKNTGSLGQETGLITGRIPVASGDDHIDTNPSLTPLRIESGKLHVENNLYITGSLTASAFSGSVEYEYINNKPTLVSSSTQVKELLPTGTLSSSAQYPGWVTASSQVDYTQLQNIPTGIVSSSTQINTGSFTGSFNGIFTGVVSGAAATASYVEYNDIVNKPTLISASSQVDYTQIQNVPAGIVSSSEQINTGSFSGSITTASYALTASYVSTSATSWNDVVNKPEGLVSSSLQATTWTVASSSVATSASYAATASYALSNSTIDIDTHIFNANGITNTFALSQSYNLNSLEVYVGGLSLTQTIDFTISSSTLTLISTPPSESNVLVRAYLNTTDGSSGTFYGTFIGTLDGNVTSASFAQTASYSLNAEGFDIVFAGEYETGSTTPLVNGWSPLSASYALTASHITELILNTTAPIIPKTGSVYFSNSFIYVYDGTQYKSASLN